MVSRGKQRERVVFYFRANSNLSEPGTSSTTKSGFIGFIRLPVISYYES